MNRGTRGAGETMGTGGEDRGTREIGRTRAKGGTGKTRGQGEQQNRGNMGREEEQDWEQGKKGNKR